MRKFSSCFWLLGVLSHHLNRRNDVGIRAAAANITAHELLHLGIVLPARFFRERDRGHDLSGSAIPALIGIRLDKGRLHRVQITGLTNAFDRCDLFTLMHRGEAKTGIHAAAADVHRARAALTVIASLFRSGQVQMLAKTIEKSCARIDPKIILLTVDTERHGNGILQVG